MWEVSIERSTSRAWGMERPGVLLSEVSCPAADRLEGI